MEQQQLGWRKLWRRKLNLFSWENFLLEIKLTNWSVSNWSVSNNVSVNCWCGFGDDCVESVDIISGVVNSSDWAIRFDQRVLSLNNSSITDFALWLNITSQTIMNSIVERVTWVWLFDEIRIFNYYLLTHSIKANQSFLQHVSLPFPLQTTAKQ